MVSMLRYVSGIVFGLVGGLHLVRLVAGWELVVNGYLIPVWLSAVIGALLVALSWGHLCPT